MTYLTAMAVQLAYAAPLLLALVIGAAVLAPRAGAGKGLVWAGALVLVVARLVGVAFSTAIPYLAGNRTAGIATWSTLTGILTTTLQIVGVLALMMAAARAGRSGPRSTLPPQQSAWPPSGSNPAAQGWPPAGPPSPGGYPPAASGPYPGAPTVQR